MEVVPLFEVDGRLAKPNLHDGEIIGIDFNSKNASCVFTIRCTDGAYQLLCSGVSSLVFGSDLMQNVIYDIYIIEREFTSNAKVVARACELLTPFGFQKNGPKLAYIMPAAGAEAVIVAAAITVSKRI